MDDCQSLRTPSRPTACLAALVAMALFFAATATAQSGRIRFDHLTIADGLSQGSANDIVQDERGFIWIGTQDGLNRYDGTRFEIFRHDPDDPESLPENFINNINLDEDGLWIIFNRPGVLSRLDLTTGKFQTWRHDPEDPESFPISSISGSIAVVPEEIGWLSTRGEGIVEFVRGSERFRRIQHDPEDPEGLPHNLVHGMFQDSEGFVWIVTPEGTARTRPPTDGTPPRFEKIAHNPDDPSSLSTDVVINLFEDQAGDLWLCTNGAGVNRLAKADREAADRFEHYFNDPQAGVRDRTCWWMAEATDGTLWFRGPNGMKRLDPKTGEVAAYRYDPNNPHSIGPNTSGLLQDRTGTIWLADNGDGLRRYNAETDDFTVYRHAAANPYSLSGDFVRNLYEDRSGVLWIGTNGDGVSRFSRDNHKFVLYDHDPSDPASLSDNMVFSIHEDRAGTLWVGTNSGGLHRYDAQREKVVERYFNNPGDPRDLGGNYVSSILEDSMGSFWVLTARNGLAEIDRDAGRVVRRYLHDPEDPESFPQTNNARNLFEDSRGDIWIAAIASWTRFDPETGKFKNYFNRPPQPRDGNENQFPVLGVKLTREDSRGRLWIGGHSGISLFDPETETFTTYSHDHHDPNTLSHDTVMDIYGDPDGTLWISTYGGGLNHFDPETGTFQRITTKNGLPSDALYGILPDEEGNLWISSNGGLSRMDPETITFTNFNVDDGLQSNEFNDSSFFRNPRTGEMYFGGLYGFNRFHPSEIRRSDYKPRVVLTSFRKFDRNVPLDRSLDQIDEVRVGYKENFFSFEFASLDFSKPHRNQYRYKLEDFNDEWIDAGPRRFANFTNLDGGTYTFRVQGTNGDGVWNEESASIRVVVIPPPWKTWWAYCLYVLTVAGLVFGYVRYKTAAQKQELERQRKEAKRLRQIDRMKDEFLANTSHELRTPLNGIIGIAQSLIDGVTGDLSEATRSNLFMVVSSGRRLAHLVDDILDFSKLKKHEIKLRRNSVALHELTGFVLTLSRPLLSGKTLELINDVPEDLPPVDADVNRLQQILHNLIGNAIKFTEDGSVRVTAVSNNGTVEVTVADTGLGIPANKLGRIFESFEQADGGSTRNYGGTGLGLTITRQLVELHGGKIRAASEVGQGTELTFSLPIWDEEKRGRSRPRAEGRSSVFPGDGSGSWASSSSSALALAQVRDLEPATPIDLAEAPVNSNGNGNGAGVLIVDDEPVNLQVLRNVLTLEGFEINQARDGAECLEYLAAGNTPDIILLDVMMPGMTGLQVTEEIRRDYSANDLPILLVTAKNQVKDLENGLASGANDYLTKPFSRNELLARMRTHLSLARAHTIEAENRRKTEELEQARVIQLSLLPSAPPALPFLEIAAHMETATEVGGDYYDFFVQDDGALYVVTGDATGHGISAGMMVSMTKSALKALDVQSPHMLLGQLNKVLRAVQLERIQMALNVSYITEHEIALSSAAMPPAYLYHDGKVDEVLLPALPLGSREGTAYDLKVMPFEPGDVFLLISDGLPELMRDCDDVLGYDIVEQCLATHGDRSAEEIRDALLQLGSDWTEERSDDVTVVVVKHT